MDSSILFLATIALVLCYLVPGWLRTRHNASHSRLDDRFSRAMRMVTPREVKHVSGSRGLILRDGPAGENCSDDDELTELPVLRGSCRPSRRSRQVGATLLLALLAAPVLVVLALLGVVQWAVPALDVALAASCLGALRLRVRRHQGRPVMVAEPVLVTATEQTGRPATTLYDEDAILAVERATAVAAARAVAAEKARVRAELEANLQPGEWLPTEVPKPSYLLKPSAPARRPAPELIDLREPTPADDGGIVDLRESSDDHTWLDEHAPLRRASGT